MVRPVLPSPSHPHSQVLELELNRFLLWVTWVLQGLITLGFIGLRFSLQILSFFLQLRHSELSTV